MSSTTTRLGLYKPATTGESVNVATDLNNNYDKIDTNINFRVVANATARNAISPTWEGLSVRETDTGRCYVTNGSAPVSASWTEIITTGATFTLTGANLVNLSGSASSTDKLGAFVAGDTFDRYRLRADGRQEWGTGALARDVNLYRGGTNLLQTDDSFTVGTDLTVTGTFAGASNVNTGGWTSYTPTWTGSTTNPVLNNGVLVGRYQRTGRTITCHVNLIPGSTTTYGSGNYNFALPVQAANQGCSYIGSAHLLGANRWMGQTVISPNATSFSPFFNNSSAATTASFMSPTIPEAFGNGDALRCTFVYEAIS
ncbi:hypothetical protein [Streptomyces sp. NPDC005385]|uniref:hypothetical protein n=1 Tax=Streptomyces sp. NPDC005385 TaxID=3157039 RepID=UPI0033BBE7F3